MSEKTSMGAAQKQDNPNGDFKLRVNAPSDSLRNGILSLVTTDRFDAAVQELRYYQQYKSDIMVFHERTERYFDHCEELVLAIKAKKSFPNMDVLPMAKKQEIFDRIQQHFDELTTVMKRIEQIENDIKVQDARSTIWVLQAFIVSSTTVIIWAVLVEALRSMGMSFSVLLEDSTKLFFKLLGM